MKLTPEELGTHRISWTSCNFSAVLLPRFISHQLHRLIENCDHLYCLTLDGAAQSSLFFFLFCLWRHRLGTCAHKIPQLPTCTLDQVAYEIPARWRQAAMNSAKLELHPQSRDLSWKVVVKHLCQRQPISVSNWVHLSLALFLFWFCDFSALYRNGIFWHLNKGDLSSKFSLFVFRILYYSSPSPNGTFFSSPAKLFSLEIMGTEVLGSGMPLFPDPRSSKFRSDECGIIKPRPQGQWSDGLAALTLFQSHRPPPSLDQQLPSRATGEESTWSQHCSPHPPSLLHPLNHSSELIEAESILIEDMSLLMRMP